MNKSGLSLCMIVRNEAKELPTLWASVKHIVDEWIVVDTGSSDDTVGVAERLGAKVFKVGERFTTTLTKEHVEFFEKYGVETQEQDRVFEFSRARNFSFEQATQPFILWLDADDLLVGSQNLKRIIGSNLDVEKQLGLHLLYKYEVDQYQNSIVEHYRERVVPNNKTFKWQGRIHEILVPSLETSYIKVLPQDSYILHRIGSERRARSADRNLMNLLLDLYEQGDSPDPRTLFYLAEGLKVAKKEKALELYEKYVSLSGWDEEKCLAATRISDIWLHKGDAKKALDWAYKSIQFKPDFPSGYANVAQCYYQMELLHECELFAKLALNMEQPDTLTLVNPKHNQFTPLLLLADCYFRRGYITEAKQFAEKALEHETQNEYLLNIISTCKQLELEEEISASYKRIGDYLVSEGEVVKAVKLLDQIPLSHADDPRLQALTSKYKQEIIKRQTAPVLPRYKSESEPVHPDHIMLVDDLKKQRISSIVLYNCDPILKKYIISNGFAVVKNHADAVYIDSGSPEGFDTHGARLVAFSVPNKSTSGVQAYTTDVTEKLAWGQLVTNTPLQNGMIYCSFKPNSIPVCSLKIAFICGGDSSEVWGPLSIYKGGIGGSEEAVVYLSKELAKLGHDVTVYNQYPHPCTYDGVRWKHHATLLGEDEFDVAVLWRIPHHLDTHKFKASRTLLWLHDVPEKYWFTPERLKQVDKIIVLSQFHRTLLAEIPDEKFFISQNGVELSQFSEVLPRDPKKVIYTSSYDRGLEHLLKIWPDVVAEVPDANLHIFYGWGTFDSLRTDEKHQEWKSKMIELMSTLPNVTEHGRIDQVRLARELLSSGIFAYPCHFEEISCISAMKAQVAGCIPLTSGYSALAETNLTAYKVSGEFKEGSKEIEEFKNNLITLLKQDIDKRTRVKISRAAQGKFSWSSVAEQWNNQFKEILK